MKDFQIINWPSNSDTINIGKFGEVNRKTLSDEKAQQLFNQGFPYIKKKGSAAKAKGTVKKATPQK